MTAAVAPRVALLVHNRLEVDPRVTRHGQAALGAGYRVVVLSVVEAEHNAAPPRWGAKVELGLPSICHSPIGRIKDSPPFIGAAHGVTIYESRVVRRTLLGMVRRIVTERRSVRADRAAAVDAAIPADAAVDVPMRTGWRSAVRDLFQIALLVRNNVGVFQQFRGSGAALVHANDLNVLLAGFLLSRAWGVPLLYDSHELWTELDHDWSPLRRRLYAALERYLIRRSSAVVTVNAAIADELARRYDVPTPTVVMNCPTLDQSPDELPVAPSAQRVRAIYQGKLDGNRGLMHILDATEQVADVALSMRGPGSEVQRLEARIRHLGLQERAEVLPPVPMRDLVLALQGYEVGVVPYLPDGMNFQLCSPNKLFEYMAAGLAVVCSDLPVLRQIIQDAECGLLYQPGDAASLAAALRRLAQDRTLLQRLRSNALTAARTRYNAAHEEGRLLELYTSLLGGLR